VSRVTSNTYRHLRHSAANLVQNPSQVLLVEDMPDTQERALREELRKWRRPDDEFAYELVIVHNFEDALIAARLNYNIQALAGIRPELDLYLMTGNKITEISPEDVAGWMGHHFRRIFHSREAPSSCTSVC